MISAEHVMASSAIPLLFPPAMVKNIWYGDGCIRNQSCGPAFYLGADKIMVIGVRRNSQILEPKEEQACPAPSVARVLNVLLIQSCSTE